MFAVLYLWVQKASPEARALLRASRAAGGVVSRRHGLPPAAPPTSNQLPSATAAAHTARINRCLLLCLRSQSGLINVFKYIIRQNT